jgi:1-aminocyclopropane-1-carboxylate deaminase
MLHYTPTPVTELHIPEISDVGINLLVKHEYMNHPFISGNKWWKLNYNLEKAIAEGYNKILTFGGAYSNHIYATAAAARELQIQSVGVIRGERTLPLNNTMTFAEETGMHLHYTSRETYRKKTEQAFIQDLENKFGRFYLIPEGGANDLAVKGCVEFTKQELQKISFDYLCLPVGTGGTMAGLICGLKGEKNIIGVSVLKDGGSLEKEVNTLTQNYSGGTYGNWQLLTSYHHGGYARASEELKRFIVKMKLEHNLLLDHVYTAKLLWAVIKEAQLGAFIRGSTVLVLHTGGLQGTDHDKLENTISTA